MAHCEASAIYLCPFDPKLFVNLSLSKYLTCAKIQLYLPSQTSSMIFQSSCLREAFVKEVLTSIILMSWNFACLFLCSYYLTPTNFSSIPWSMWAHHQIFDFVNIFRLWSKYILYFFILLENLPEHSPTQITALHQIWHQFLKPIFL